MSTTDTTGLPDYAPVPSSALGPALNEQGYFVGRVERNLYCVTDGSYQCAFLTTSDGVVLLDAPPSRLSSSSTSATREEHRTTLRTCRKTSPATSRPTRTRSRTRGSTTSAATWAGSVRATT